MTSIRNRMNNAQKTMLLESLDNNFEFEFGHRFGPAIAKQSALWNKLAISLNKLGTSVKKSGEGWKKSWNDLRLKACRKLAVCQQNGEAPGNEDLTDSDRAVVRISNAIAEREAQRKLLPCTRNIYRVAPITELPTPIKVIDETLDPDPGYSEKCAIVFRTRKGVYSFSCEFCKKVIWTFDQLVEHLNAVCKPIESSSMESASFTTNFLELAVRKEELSETSKLIALAIDENEMEGQILYPEFVSVKQELNVDLDDKDSSLFKYENFELTNIKEESDTDEYFNETYRSESLPIDMSSCFKCVDCNRSFKTEANLIRHENFHSKILTCPYSKCYQKYRSQAKLDRHIVKNHIEAQCDQCPMIFSSVRGLKTHKVVHNKQLECDLCHKFFGNKSSMRCHMVSHTKAKRFKCDQCGEGFAHSYRLTRHKLQHTGQLPDKRHVCDICGTKFQFKFKLEKHLRMHAGAPDHPCSKCDKAFYSKKKLTTHFQRLHTDERPWKCRYCPLSFRNNDTRKRHEIKMHDGVEYPCTMCDKTFYTSQYLQLHLQRDHADHL